MYRSAEENKRAFLTRLWTSYRNTDSLAGLGNDKRLYQKEKQVCLHEST